MSYWDGSPDHDVSEEKWTIERFLLSLIAGAYRVNGSKLPMKSFGTYNALLLYLNHSHYSPFMPLGEYCTEEERQKNIDELIHDYRDGWNTPR